jgi:membrane-associated protease RseP (regulator of RpoE activity)
VYKDHQEGSAKDLERFYQAQCLWDEGMAETLSEFLRLPENRGKIVFVFAGNGHVIFDFGIPRRFFRRTPLPFKTVILKEWRHNIGADPDIRFASISQPLGDYLWITQPNPPGIRHPRIGVVFKEAMGEEGLQIERVIPGSPAEKAGLLAGDQLLTVEGRGIAKAKDIHDAVVQKGWANDITFTVLREGMKKDITVKLPIIDE